MCGDRTGCTSVISRANHSAHCAHTVLSFSVLQLCGRLPLCLNIVGNLIRSFGEGWETDVPVILRTDMSSLMQEGPNVTKAGEGPMSMQQRVIQVHFHAQLCVMIVLCVLPSELNDHTQLISRSERFGQVWSAHWNYSAPGIFAFT